MTDTKQLHFYRDVLWPDGPWHTDKKTRTRIYDQHGRLISDCAPHADTLGRNITRKSDKWRQHCAILMSQSPDMFRLLCECEKTLILLLTIEQISDKLPATVKATLSELNSEIRETLTACYEEEN